MSRDWKRLASAIEAARDAKAMTQVALADAAGVSESTVQNLESGAARKRTPSTLPKVEAALGWAPGSGLAVLSGGDPTPLKSDHGGDQLPMRIRRALGDGPLLDTKILDLEDNSGARMIVVIKGKEGASPEELRRALEAWERTEAQLLAGGENDAAAS